MKVDVQDLDADFLVFSNYIRSQPSILCTSRSFTLRSKSEASKFGLMQITRQRVRPAMDVNTTEICPTCFGNYKRGVSQSVATQMATYDRVI